MLLGLKCKIYFEDLVHVTGLVLSFKSCKPSMPVLDVKLTHRIVHIEILYTNNTFIHN